MADTLKWSCLHKLAVAVIVLGLQPCVVALSKTNLKSAIRPNIIFIMVDDLGWAELGCYGNTFNETPNLNKLAEQGMRFTDAYAAAPICSPTRASVVTGQYPARLRITDYLPSNAEKYLDPAKYITINEALSASGYHTGMIGKWHLDDHYDAPLGSPKQHGFDEVIGTETSFIGPGDYFAPYTYVETLNREAAENEFLTDRLFQEAADFIERNQDSPFFLYLTPFSVHTWLDAPEEVFEKYCRKYDKKYGVGKSKAFLTKDNPGREGHPDNPWLAAMLERIDAGVGRIMQQLDMLGLANNTMLVFFSDNGGYIGVSNNGQLRLGKSWLYEGGIRDSLIIRYPKVVPKDSVCRRPVSSIDFYPTFLDAAGIEKPKNHILDGLSMMPLLTQKYGFKRDVLYWHYPSETAHWHEKMAGAVRQGPYKLIEFYDDDRIELYNLEQDISEANDLSKKEPEKANELYRKLSNWRKELGVKEIKIPPLHDGFSISLGVPYTDETLLSFMIISRNSLETVDGQNYRSFNGVYEYYDLASKYAPRLVDRSIIITTRCMPKGRNGVLIAQGAAYNGYSLYLIDGQLHFTVVKRGERHTIRNTAVFDTNTWYTVKASILNDGTMSLLVDDTKRSETKLKYGFDEQPLDALQIGYDSNDPVAEYPYNNAGRYFYGLIDTVSVECMVKDTSIY
jgi:arylsulfatase A-like enzyme